MTYQHGVPACASCLLVPELFDWMIQALPFLDVDHVQS